MPTFGALVICSSYSYPVDLYDGSLGAFSDDLSELPLDPSVAVVNTEACCDTILERLEPSDEINFIKLSTAIGDERNDNSHSFFASTVCKRARVQCWYRVRFRLRHVQFTHTSKGGTPELCFRLLEGCPVAGELADL